MNLEIEAYEGELRRLREAAQMAIEALQSARRNHGVMCLSDPPRPAWQVYGVEAQISRTLTALEQSLQGINP